MRVAAESVAAIIHGAATNNNNCIVLKRKHSTILLALMSQIEKKKLEIKCMLRNILIEK